MRLTSKANSPEGPHGEDREGWIHALLSSPSTLLRGTSGSMPGMRASLTDRQQCSGTLEQVIIELRGLNESTEADFLKIGEKLVEFLQTSDRISSGIRQLAASKSGEDGGKATDVLTAALHRCKEMETRTAERGRNLGDLRSNATRVRSAFAEFKEAVSTFRVICTLTRIETARLASGEADLGFLDEDIKRLAENMGSRVAMVLEAALGLDQQIEESVASLSGVEALLRDLSHVVTDVMNNLGAFSEQQKVTASLSQKLASDSGSVSNSIKDAVMSIQFHDITRQQVEHVAEALEHICSIGKGGGTNLSREASAALSLEASQLSSAHQKFSASVQRLAHDLQSIATSVEDMSANGRTLMNASASGEDAFFLKMEKCLTSILDTAATYDKAERDTEEAVAVLTATLGEMLSGAGEIREIDGQLLRVALNANIRACGIGNAGNTLSVLADSLQTLSVTSHDRSDIIAGLLESMSASVNGLSRNLDPAVREQLLADDAAAMNDMRAAIKDLHGLGTESSTRTAEITTLAAQLCQDISAAKGGFSAGTVFTEVVNRCHKILLQMSAKGPRSASSKADTAALQGFSRNYTMQAEREVHAAATRSTNPKPAPASALKVAPAGKASDESFGENFEMF